MKAKNILLLAALATGFFLSSCANQEPFDTQSENDAPQILKPYNESGTGSFTYMLASPDTKLVDSVTVTPSRYTTVNWYVDDQLVFTGTKIEMAFPGGVHTLVIEAVTTAGKRTERKGTIIVKGGEKELWAGPKDLDWDANSIRVRKDVIGKTLVGSTVRIYFKHIEDADYYALRIIPGDHWGDEASAADNVLPKIDTKEMLSPVTFVYDDRCKGLVDGKGSMSLVGNGMQILLIDFE